MSVASRTTGAIIRGLAYCIPVSVYPAESLERAFLGIDVMHRYDGLDYVMQPRCTQTFMFKVGGQEQHPPMLQMASLSVLTGECLSFYGGFGAIPMRGCRPSMRTCGVAR